MFLLLTLLVVTEYPTETQACLVTLGFALPCYIPNAGRTTVTDITSQLPPPPATLGDIITIVNK